MTQIRLSSLVYLNVAHDAKKMTKANPTLLHHRTHAYGSFDPHDAEINAQAKQSDTERRPMIPHATQPIQPPI